MQKKINNVKVNYEYIDNKKKTTLIFLHGWGQNINMMEPLSVYFKEDYNILIIDIPGFGESDEPDTPWDIFDYAKFLKSLLDQLKIKDIILVGHSFGGRIALVYSSLYKTEKLVCLASPYCKELKKLPLKNRIYKRIKNIKILAPLVKKMQNKIGSTDYKNASPIMRGVLVKAVNLDLTEVVKNINCPTLLIWGALDTAVPLKRAYELEKLIPDAGVVVYDDADHYAYIEKSAEIAVVLKTFFNN